MNPTPTSPDRLIQELRQHEAELQVWLQSSAVNALWFLVDPVDALRTANLGLSEESLQELQKTFESLQAKLGPMALQAPVSHAVGTQKPQNRITAS